MLKPKTAGAGGLEKHRRRLLILLLALACILLQPSAAAAESLATNAGAISELAASSATAQAGVAITAISFRPGAENIFEIKLDFSGRPPQPSAYVTETPPRFVLDFDQIGSTLEQNQFLLSRGNISDVLVLESGDRTRLVVNQLKLAPHMTHVEGHSLIIEVRDDDIRYQLREVPAPALMNAPTVAREASLSMIEALEFQRGSDGAGQVELTLADPDVAVNIVREAAAVRVEFLDTGIRAGLQRHYDVSGLNTPVSGLELLRTERGVTVLLKTSGDYDYLAYQTGHRYVISLQPPPAGSPEQGDADAYTGERLSLNFQDIEVRAVLKLIADFTQLNLVVSDTVSGHITLRLQNVPWDQALDLVLKTKGLDQRHIGNVLMVAPVEEIAERERQQIEANRQLAELAPLETDFLQIRYASAADVVGLISANSGEGNLSALVSARGSVVLDERTNAVLITDTAARLAQVREFIERIDVPIRQVMIEARIVAVQSDVAQSLGIRWGGAAFNRSADEVTLVSGSLESVESVYEGIVAGEPPGVNFPGALLVDLGLSSTTSGIAVGYTSADLLLSAELSALENSGSGEVISQPKVITGDKQQATIKSGTEIPFQVSADNGETTTSFREAVLALEVTPNITPDDHILLDLAISQDSVGELVPSGQGGYIPSIDTTRLTTQVLVGNGETVVLGGVFRTEDIDSISKVPLLGDIPYLGNLFKRTTSRQAKTETLIFITPQILSETLQD